MSAFLHRGRNRPLGFDAIDLAAIFGLHPQKNALDVYREVGIKPDTRKPPRQHPEDWMAAYYQHYTGSILCCTSWIQHKTYPYLITKPDRVLLEGKGLSLESVEDEKRQALWRNDMPLYYAVQMAHNRLVLGYAGWDAAVLVEGLVFRIYALQPNVALDQLIIKTSQHFWENHIAQDCPPPRDRQYPEVATLVAQYPPQLLLETKLSAFWEIAHTLLPNRADPF